MLDIKFIRENRDLVKKAAHDKNIVIDIDYLLKLDESRRELTSKLDDLRSQKNKASKVIPQANPGEKEKILTEMKEVSKEAEKLEEELKKIKPEYEEMIAIVPNIPSEDTPIAPDENGNVEIERWGEVPEFDFDIKTHFDLGNDLDILDLDRGAKVSGFRGYFLKNQLALLHHAIMLHAFKKMYEKGYTAMITPTIIKEKALFGSGHFPGEREEIYEVEELGEKEKETKFLAGTSEPSLLAYKADEIIDESELPLKYSGLSQCYRREVGGYGKDTKGIYRIHEFMKVEQVIICKNNLDISLSLFEELKQNAIEILKDLKLPHRVIQICTGDMGAGKYKMYDIETWMPSRESYGETHSNSHLTDWQARRLNMRYRTKEGKIEYPHTMNNTAIASPRILIAVLENNQAADGSIRIPEVLAQYVGFDTIKPLNS